MVILNVFFGIFLVGGVIEDLVGIFGYGIFSFRKFFILVFVSDEVVRFLVRLFIILDFRRFS